MKEYTSKEAAKIIGVRRRHINGLCEAGKMAGAKKANGRWLIPATAHPKLAAAAGICTPADSQQLAELPAAAREKALRRAGLIERFNEFAAAAIDRGVNRSESLAAFARQAGIGARSLERWLADYRRAGATGLIDGRLANGREKEAISPEAWELFKSMWLDQRQLSVKLCWQNVSYVNKSEQKGWRIPTLAKMYRLIDQNIPVPVRVLLREGLGAYEARCAPYVETDPDSIEAGAAWVGDHSVFNCWIHDRGRWIRPWLTAWQDMRSRMIVGWHICPAPNQTTILLAMKRGLEKYGPPEGAKIDNGRDYDSEMWTGTTKARRRLLAAGYIDEQMLAGIYAMLGVAVTFSIKYHPQSKPVERFFDTLDCQLTKTIPTYCGKDTGRRPEDLADYLKTEKAVAEAYDLAAFAELVGRHIEVYNNTAHSGRGMAGRTPAEVFNERSSRRVLADGVLDLLMRVWSGQLKVGKNGVRFKGMWYGQYDAELLSRFGQLVRVAYDPDDLRQVYIYDAATLRLITIAEQNRLIAYGRAVDEQSLRDAMHAKARAVRIAKSYVDTRLTAAMDLPSLTLAAMADCAGKQRPAERPATLRPVRTPLDSQVAEHRRRETVRAVRKAAGAEGTTTVLNLDFESLKKPAARVELGLFKNG